MAVIKLDQQSKKTHTHPQSQSIAFDAAGPTSHKMIIDALTRDSNWMKDKGFMDYSLIVGVVVGEKEKASILFPVPRPPVPRVLLSIGRALSAALSDF